MSQLLRDPLGIFAWQFFVGQILVGRVSVKPSLVRQIFDVDFSVVGAVASLDSPLLF